MPAAYVTHGKTGGIDHTVTVPAGTDRLLVVITIASDEGYTPSRTVTYGGVTLDIATSTNDWVQIHYMLSPPVGDATLTVSGDKIDWIVDAHYTGIGSHTVAAQGSSASLSAFVAFDGVMVMGQESNTSSHTALADSNTREDTENNWFGDRFVTTAPGTFSVGVVSSSDPHSAQAVFLEPMPTVSVSGAVAAPRAAPTTSGQVTVRVAPTGAAAAIRPTVTGSVTVNITAIAGAPSALISTATGIVTLSTNASGAVTAPSPTVYGDVILHGAGRPHALIPRTPRPRASVRET